MDTNTFPTPHLYQKQAHHYILMMGNTGTFVLFFANFHKEMLLLFFSFKTESYASQFT